MSKEEIKKSSYYTIRSNHNFSLVVRWTVGLMILDYLYLVGLIVLGINIFQNKIHLVVMLILGFLPFIVLACMYIKLKREIVQDMKCMCMYCGKESKNLQQPEELREYFEFPVCPECADMLLAREVLSGTETEEV